MLARKSYSLYFGIYPSRVIESATSANYLPGTAALMACLVDKLCVNTAWDKAALGSNYFSQGLHQWCSYLGHNTESTGDAHHSKNQTFHGNFSKIYNPLIICSEISRAPPIVQPRF